MDPDGRAAVVDDAIVGVVALGIIAIGTVTYMQTDAYKQGSQSLTNAVSAGVQSLNNCISNIKSSITAKTGENNKNNGITMYHYSDTPPSQFKGALRPDSYISPDKYAKGSEAREKLAIPRKDDGSEKSIKYRYSVKVKPGEYRPAENSIPGTNTVAELDGKKGGGTEFKTNVPLVPYKCEVIPE